MMDLSHFYVKEIVLPYLFQEENSLFTKNFKKKWAKSVVFKHFFEILGKKMQVHPRKKCFKDAFSRLKSSPCTNSNIKVLFFRKIFFQKCHATWVCLCGIFFLFFSFFGHFSTSTWDLEIKALWNEEALFSWFLSM